MDIEVDTQSVSDSDRWLIARHSQSLRCADMMMGVSEEGGINIVGDLVRGDGLVLYTVVCSAVPWLVAMVLFEDTTDGGGGGGGAGN